MRDRRTAWLALTAVLLLTAAPVAPAMAADSEEKPAQEAQGANEQKGPLRVEDLPKPVPKVLDKLKKVGNEVGEEISKASSKTASALKKAFSSQPQEKKQGKENK
jgi:hypothetical protein